jgi:ABC-type molybdate transport system permease subunit
MIQTVLNLLYHLIALVLIVVVAWNMMTISDRRKQLMGAVVLIPLVLRFLNLK